MDKGFSSSRDPRTRRPPPAPQQPPKTIGKIYALNKYDQLALNTSCFGGSTGSNVTPVVQFHEIFVTKIMNSLIYIIVEAKISWNFMKS